MMCFLVAPILAVAASASQVPDTIDAFEYDPDKIVTGTAFFYVKSNVDGGRTSQIVHYSADKFWFEALQWSSDDGEATLIRARMNWERFSVSRFEGYKVDAAGTRVFQNTMVEDAEYLGEEERHGTLCLKYSVNGGAIQDRGGELWLDKAHGHLVHYEMDLPHEPGFISGERKFVRSQKMTADEWAQFLKTRKTPPPSGDREDGDDHDPLDECTNLLVTAGASTTGSVSICYTCDAPFASRLAWIPSGDHEPGALVSLPESRARGEVRQVAHTYAVLASNGIGHMNEHQLAIGETTFGGRRGLNDPVGLHYADLMTLALQRARTAREAIETIAELAEEYGYTQSGESISIGDPEEAWIMEIIGNGKEEKGIVWVAVRVPDGQVSAHANQSRIGEFPLDDPENCMYSKDVIDFAVEQGFYDPASGEAFNFSDAYHPPSTRTKKACAMRVWSILRRVAPDLELSADYHRGVEHASRYPLSVLPAKKLAVSDVFALLRDHYEGTDYDMAACEEAGKFSSPYVARTERAISIPGTSFSIVTQSRSHLPDPVGGVVWYSPDDTFFSCYTPLYCGTQEIPEAYASGDRKQFDWDSAWWAFNFVANQAYPRYSLLKGPIQEVQSALERGFMERQPGLEAEVEQLLGNDPAAATELLTRYTVESGQSVARRWKALGEQLVVQFNDGRGRPRRGRPRQHTIALFNGEDLEGWHTDIPEADAGAELSPSFIPRDGLLISNGSPQGHLITDRSFRDYRLTVEYRWPGKPGNCGILVHASTPRRLYGMFPASIECQMYVGNAGDFWCIGEDIEVPDMEKRRGAKENWGVDEGKGRRIKNLTDGSEAPQGEWNTMVIECRGSSVEVWVNGDKVNHGTNCTADHGQIAIQAEGAVCEFRKVELTTISGSGS